MAIAADNHADTFENIISDFGGDGCQYRCEVNPRSVGGCESLDCDYDFTVYHNDNASNVVACGRLEIRHDPVEYRGGLFNAYLVVSGRDYAYKSKHTVPVASYLPGVGNIEVVGSLQLTHGFKMAVGVSLYHFLRSQFNKEDSSDLFDSWMKDWSTAVLGEPAILPTAFKVNVSSHRLYI
jgi:hypothetical protein